ncbi:MAG: DUF3500 domain-containing protein [Verrucomicrobiales bacterium]|nr:DUF3500 domain-containing protein [Verrucomicrobiales bacterium]
MKFKSISLLVWCMTLSLALVSSRGSAHEVADVMAEAAQNFLQSLEQDQKTKALLVMESKERGNWHYIPKPFEGEKMRKGLPMMEMRDDQKALVFALLSTAMSHRGFAQAATIMSLERVVWELENQAAKRRADAYYVSIFDEPKVGGTWGWRVEGHHVSVNFTIVEGKVVSVTPNFFGANPAEVKSGSRKGLRVLAAEEDLARALLKSLDESQRKVAVIADKAPRDVVAPIEAKVSPLEGKGLVAAKMNADQKKMLRALVEEYVRRLRPVLADADLKKIDAAGFEKILFVWAGGEERGQGNYYRVQGPTFLLEYSNTQNDANHAHAVWRDFDGDFGADVLKAHYLQGGH